MMRDDSKTSHWYKPTIHKIEVSVNSDGELEVKQSRELVPGVPPSLTAIYDVYTTKDIYRVLKGYYGKEI